MRTTVHNKVVFAVDTILTIGGDIHFHRVAQAYIVIAAYGVSIVACHIERTRPREDELSLAEETSLLVFINAINRDRLRVTATVGESIGRTVRHENIDRLG